MKIFKMMQQLLVVSFLLAISCVHAEETKKFVFQKQGFTVDVPRDLGLHCDPDKMETLAEAHKSMSTVCTSPYRNDLVLKLGWRARSLSNADFAIKTMSELVGLNFGAGKPYDYTCDNNTGIDDAIGARKYPDGEKFETRTFPCAVVVTDTSSSPPLQHKFTIFFFFFTGKNLDVVNWMTVSDVMKPGSVTGTHVVNLAKTIKKIPD